jgi:hypothetical protein
VSTTRTDLASDVLRKIEKAENGIARHELVEETVIFDQGGNELVRKESKGAVIHFTEKELSRFAGNIAIHNHLRVGSFSVHDAGLLYWRPYELRAVDAEYRYSLRPKPGTKPPDRSEVKALQEDARREERRLLDAYADRYIANGQPPPDILHEVWLRIADEYGVIYTRERR